jgi:hypothetical protein
MFFTAFFITAYWFIFYKMQKNATILLPSTVILNQAYLFFNTVFFVILGTKTAAIFIRVLMQASADIFIMDWEKPKQQF